MDDFYKEIKYPDLYNVEFNTFIKKNVIPLVDFKEINEIQKEYTKYMIKFLLFFGVPAFLWFFFSCTFPIIGVFIIIFFILLCVVICTAKSSKDKGDNSLSYRYNAACKKMKKSVFPVLLSKYIGECRYNDVNEEDYGLRKYIDSLFLFKKRGGVYVDTIDDHFILEYKGMHIKICDISLPGDETYINNKRVKVRGGPTLFMSVKCERNFYGNTVIIKDFLGSKSLGKDFQKVELELKSFNDYFRVESTDQVEARYLISPVFIERAIELSKKYKVSEMGMSFEKQHFNIILCSEYSYVNYFEITKKYDIDVYREIIIQIRELLALIDFLNIS